MLTTRPATCAIPSLGLVDRLWPAKKCLWAWFRAFARTQIRSPNELALNFWSDLPTQLFGCLRTPNWLQKKSALCLWATVAWDSSSTEAAMLRWVIQEKGIHVNKSILTDSLSSFRSPGSCLCQQKLSTSQNRPLQVLWRRCSTWRTFTLTCGTPLERRQSAMSHCAAAVPVTVITDNTIVFLSSNRTTNYWHVDTLHKNVSAGFWHQVEGDCDSPLNFVIDSLKQIAARHPDISAVYWTGK